MSGTCLKVYNKADYDFDTKAWLIAEQRPYGNCVFKSVCVCVRPWSYIRAQGYGGLGRGAVTSGDTQFSVSPAVHAIPPSLFQPTFLSLLTGLSMNARRTHYYVTNAGNCTRNLVGFNQETDYSSVSVTDCREKRR